MSNLSRFFLLHYHLVQPKNTKERSHFPFCCYPILSWSSSTKTKCCTDGSLCLKSDPFTMSLCTSSCKCGVVGWPVQPSLLVWWHTSMSNWSPFICNSTHPCNSLQGIFLAPPCYGVSPKRNLPSILLRNLLSLPVIVTPNSSHVKNIWKIN